MLPDRLFISGPKDSSQTEFVAAEKSGGSDTEIFIFTSKFSVDHIEDGDTWSGTEKPHPGIELPDTWCRLDDIDTHETGGQHAKEAEEQTNFVSEFVKTGRENYRGDDGFPFLVRYTDPADEEVDYGGVDFEGTYGRRIVNLIRLSDRQSLRDALLDEFDSDINPKA